MAIVRVAGSSRPPKLESRITGLSKPDPVKSAQLGPIARKSAALRELGLPSERKTVEQDVLRYTGFLYGRPKIGKSTLLASFPKAIFLATEPGIKGMDVFEFNPNDGGIKDWDYFRRAVDLLETSGVGHPFRTVVIDTAARAYDMCMDYICAKLGIDSPGFTADGQNDWGISWRAIKREFLVQIHRLSQAGYGVWFTGHAKEETVTSKKDGKEFIIIRPAMSAQAREIIEALVDFFFYAEYMRDRAAGVIRVLICEGDETVWAGARKTPHGNFPKFLPLLEVDGFQVVQDAFAGTYPGLDLSHLSAAGSTSKIAKELLLRKKVELAKEPRS